MRGQDACVFRSPPDQLNPDGTFPSNTAKAVATSRCLPPFGNRLLCIGAEVGDLLDLEDDKLGGPHDGDTDLTDRTMRMSFGHHGGLVAPHEVRLVRRDPEESPAHTE